MLKMLWPVISDLGFSEVSYWILIRFQVCPLQCPIVGYHLLLVSALWNKINAIGLQCKNKVMDKWSCPLIYFIFFFCDFHCPSWNPVTWTLENNLNIKTYGIKPLAKFYPKVSLVTPWVRPWIEMRRNELFSFPLFLNVLSIIHADLPIVMIFPPINHCFSQVPPTLMVPPSCQIVRDRRSYILSHSH